MTLFKKNVATLAVGAALLVSAQVNAADDVTMKVSGTILPAACTPALSNSGEVAFGSIAASSIRKAPAGNALVQLGSKDITLTVTCDAATAIGFTMADNRASSAVTLSSSAYVILYSQVARASHKAISALVWVWRPMMRKSVPILSP